MGSKTDAKRKGKRVKKQETCCETRTTSMNDVGKENLENGSKYWLCVT